jgi:hypothetical protein
MACVYPIVTAKMQMIQGRETPTSMRAIHQGSMCAESYCRFPVFDSMCHEKVGRIAPPGPVKPGAILANMLSSSLSGIIGISGTTPLMAIAASYTVEDLATCHRDSSLCPVNTRGGISLQELHKTLTGTPGIRDHEKLSCSRTGITMVDYSLST